MVPRSRAHIPSALVTVITVDRLWLPAKLASFLTSTSWSSPVITLILQRMKPRPREVSDLSS